VKLGRIEKRKLKTRRSEAVILFSVASHRLALAAQAVEEIRNIEGLRPLHQGFGPGKVSKVKNILERDDKIYFVVDANMHLRMLSSRPARLLLMRDSSLALSVDAIDRMAEVTVLHPLPRAFRGEERDWYRGLVLIGDDVVPVLNPAALMSKAELSALESTLPRSESLTAKGAALA
jgi:chemotaxis signal transduction protein